MKWMRFRVGQQNIFSKFHPTEVTDYCRVIDTINSCSKMYQSSLKLEMFEFETYVIFTLR